VTHNGQEFLRLLPPFKSVLEVGAKNVNGEARKVIQADVYLGVDMEVGPGVDIVMRGEDLPTIFKEGEFDGLVCSDTLEHCKHWRGVLRGMWHCLAVDGLACVTAPRQGWRYHAYPHDYHRFEPEHWQQIFAGQEFVHETSTSNWGGVIVRKRGPLVDLDAINVGVVSGGPHNVQRA
jgi:hypothetical protein